MANRLTTTPTLWFVQCKYCQSIPTKDRHERELLTKARKLCKKHETNHFLDFLQAEFDTLDHVTLNPTTMIEILTQVHTATKCDCLTTTTDEIEDLTTTTPTTTTHQNITIPTQPIITHITPTTTPTHQPKKSRKTTPAQSHTQPKKPETTLLERLQRGKSNNHQHNPKPRKI